MKISNLPKVEDVKKYRIQSRLTQKELAEKAGVSTSMINQIESGRSAPSYNTAKKIFEVLATKETESSTHNAGDLCSQKIMKLKPTNTLGEAMSKMDREKISQIPIFDENIPVGVISDSGIISHMSSGV